MTPNFEGQGGFANLPRTQDPDHRKILKRSNDMLFEPSVDHSCILKDYISIFKDKNGKSTLNFRFQILIQTNFNKENNLAEK